MWLQIICYSSHWEVESNSHFFIPQIALVTCLVNKNVPEITRWDFWSWNIGRFIICSWVSWDINSGGGQVCVKKLTMSILSCYEEAQDSYVERLQREKNTRLVPAVSTIFNWLCTSFCVTCPCESWPSWSRGESPLPRPALIPNPQNWVCNEVILIWCH